MDIYEALYTTRMMRRLRPDPILNHSVSKFRSRCGRLTTTRRPTWPRWDESLS
jgi:hypothetical protein